MGNVTDGQDLEPRGAEAQDSHSGVARRAFGAFSAEDIATVLSTGFDKDVDILPTDVILQAETLNWGNGEIGDDDEHCPSYEQARGLDSYSQAIVQAFLDHSIIYVKSAGNLHGLTPSSELCYGDNVTSSAGAEISAPGAAPTALVVGNLDAADRTASEIQQSPALYPTSAWGPTRDGRTYPLLVAPGFGCGVPLPYQPGEARYDHFEGTSGASATVAGGVLLFKHWYLAKHSSYANIPGRIMSNILNMADGYVGSENAHVPAPGWGLGRFRLRLFEDGGMGGNWARATTSVVLEEGEVEVIDLGWIGRDSDGQNSLGMGADGIPATIDRLRITVWWLEPNTGNGESKADISALLLCTREDGSVDYSVATNHRVESDGGDDGLDHLDNVIRLQFGSEKVFSMPTGSVQLYLYGTVVPRAERYFEGSKRTLYVSWFWEEGRDPSLIECPPDEGPTPEDSGLGALHAPSTFLSPEPALPSSFATAALEALERKIAASASVRPGFESTPSAGDIIGAANPTRSR